MLDAYEGDDDLLADAIVTHYNGTLRIETPREHPAVRNGNAISDGNAIGDADLTGRRPVRDNPQA